MDSRSSSGLFSGRWRRMASKSASGGVRWLCLMLLAYSTCPTMNSLAKQVANNERAAMIQVSSSQEASSNVSTESRIPSRNLADRSFWSSAPNPRSSRDTFLPSYDIIGANEIPAQPNEESTAALIRLLAQNTRSINNNSSLNDILIESDFHKNLATLKKIAKAKRKRINSQSAPDSHHMKKKTSSIDDDINTINVLISMLMLASKRLVEQRDRALANSNSEFKQPIATISATRQKGTKFTMIEHQQAASQPSKTSITPIMSESSSRKRLSSKLESKLNSSSSLHLQAREVSPEERLKSQQSSQDHVLVRPGFDTKQQASEINSNSAYPIMLASHPTYHDDPMRYHKPMTAHDLLNVNRSPNYEATPAPLRFPSRNSESQHKMLDYLYPRSPPGAGLSPFHSLQAPTSEPIDSPKREQLMVPPYNGFTLTTRPSLGHSLDPPHLFSGNRMNGFPPTEPSAGGMITPSGQLMSPIEQVLAAAKSQRTAALDYERRRMQHELELQKRGDAARRRHELQLERQRQQAANMAEEAPAGGGNQLEESPVQRQGENQKANQQQQQQQQNSSGERDDRESNSSGDEEQSNQDEEGNGNGDGDGDRQSQDNPDMGSLQNFASDDFTDLFPPGILSEAEIREMRRDQEEQRQRQAQDERDKQAEEEGESDQQQQQQQPQQQESSEQVEPVTVTPQQPNLINLTSNVQHHEPNSSYSSQQNQTQMMTNLASKPTHYLPTMGSPINIPISSTLNDSTRTNKMRRSSSTQAAQSTMELANGLFEPSATINVFYSPKRAHSSLPASEQVDLELVDGNGNVDSLIVDDRI